MQIIVNGQMAALKENSSFEYVAENRSFSGADSYTLSISFPLAGCPENIAIFGYINRADVVANRVVLDCELRDASFCRFGCLTVTEITEAEVKCQFLEGRSVQNFDTTFDDIYVNELDLGKPTTTKTEDISPIRAWTDGVADLSFVALPWVNEYSGNIQNCADYSNGSYSWNEDTEGLSWMPYLIYITRRICEAVGYTCDLSAWQDDQERRYLLVCNALPYAWRMSDFALALPHWSVTEWFEKLELLLAGEFEIDHKAKHIAFAFTEAVVEAIEPVALQLVVDEHTVEVDAEDPQCEYFEAKNLRYADCSHSRWNYYSCDWILKSPPYTIRRYDTLAELVAEAKDAFGASGSNTSGGSQTSRAYATSRTSTISFHNLLYAADIDQYLIIVVTKKTLAVQTPSGMRNQYTFEYSLRPVNTFGGRLVDDDENADDVEIEFVPAWVDDTDETYGRCLFLPLSSLDDYADDNAPVNMSEEEYDQWWPKGLTEYAIINGEREKTSQYLDKVYVGIWKGALDGSAPGMLPHPLVEELEFYKDFAYSYTPNVLRINNRAVNAQRNIRQVNPKIKATFKFLSKSIPNPRALFLIRGKRYLCEKITATFTERGMSRLIKGEFYPVSD